MLYDKDVKVAKNIVGNPLIKKHFNYIVRELGNEEYLNLKKEVKKLIDNYFNSNEGKKMRARYLVPSDWTGTPVNIIWILLSIKYGDNSEIVEISGGVLGCVVRDCLMDSNEKYYEMSYNNESGYSYARG